MLGRGQVSWREGAQVEVETGWWGRGRRSEEKPRQQGQRGGRQPKETVVGPRGHVSYQPGSLWGNRRVPAAPGPRRPPGRHSLSLRPPASPRCPASPPPDFTRGSPRLCPAHSRRPQHCPSPATSPPPSPRGGEEPWRVWPRAELG